MAVRFDVRSDVREVEKMLDTLEKSLGPKVMARAINDTARHARSKAHKQTALQKNLPLKVVKNRLNILGEKKGERTTLTKANKFGLTATLLVYLRGIPVFQIANKAPRVGKQRKGGVKAYKGRFYKGAFYAPNNGVMMVFKRQTKLRYPLMVPKVGVRVKLEQLFTLWTKGILGRAYFKRRFNQLIRFELEKLNNSGRGGKLAK